MAPRYRKGGRGVGEWEGGGQGKAGGCGGGGGGGVSAEREGVFVCDGQNGSSRVITKEDNRQVSLQAAGSRCGGNRAIK